jgi:2-keto-3-deoxy-L-rhamnonate aldolase RhmA
MDNEDYFNRANDNILVALIIETREAVDNLEAIAAVPGVDAFHLGPADLSIALGSDPLHLPLPEVDAVLEGMLDVGRKTGVAMGTSANDPETLRALQDRGINFLSYGPDYTLMVKAVQAGLDAFQR